MVSSGAQRVLLVNGPASVGKTTVARQIAGQHSNSVCIHGDDLKNFVVNRNIDRVRHGLSYVGAAALADIYLNASYELVVVDLVFEQRAQVDKFLAACRNRAPVYLVTLWAPLETVLAREETRAVRALSREQVALTWHTMCDNLTQLGVTIDATPSPDQVTAAIAARLAADPAPIRRARWRSGGEQAGRPGPASPKSEQPPPGAIAH